MSDWLDQADVNHERIKQLSRETGLREEDLTVLERDPFDVGTEGNQRDIERFVVLMSRANLLGADTHLRSVHYTLLSTGADYKAEEWTWLISAAGYARDSDDHPDVPPWAFPDMRTNQLLANGRGVGPVEIEVMKPSLHVPVYATVSDAEVDGFDLLHAQPVRVLVCIEKDSPELRGEIVAPCRRAGAELRVTIGNPTKTLAARLCQEAMADGRPLVVFWLSDADSSGEHMANVMARHIEFIRSRYEDVPPVYVQRIALTLEQVKEIEAEIGREIPLAPDVRRDEGRVELNALPIYAPGWLGRQVEQAFDSVTVQVDEPDPGVPDELADVIAKGERIADRLLDRVRPRLAEVERIVSEAIEDWQPDEVEVDVPELDLERDWILDPDRDYLEQLNAYRRHGAAHRDRTPLDFAPRPPCLECGGSMDDKVARAKFCSRPCARRYGVRRRAQTGSG